jgi:dipeptidyl aminopeptidase/acylaminoacyl peptidase
MKTNTPHIRLLPSARTIAFLVVAGLVAAAASTQPSRADARRHPQIHPPQVLTIAYTAHNGARREATVLLPAGYRPGDRRALPLVISPHGRGATGRSNSTFWGSLPTRGRFAVINPDGMGRQLKNFSYGYRGEINDLARMPAILRSALPWVRIDPTRIYALGSSMGGQETLLLVARHPRLLAGAVAMDSVTDLALRYRQVRELPTDPEFVRRWGASESDCLRSAMRREVGATPATAPRAYAARSPLRLARQIAASGVPLQIWWSRKDQIVMHQETQSGALYRTLRKLTTTGLVRARIGSWKHSTEMRSAALLPVALRSLGLLPCDYHTCLREV